MAPMRLFCLCCALSLSLTQASFDDASALLQTEPLRPYERSHVPIQTGTAEISAVPGAEPLATHKHRLLELDEEIEQRKRNIANLKVEVEKTKSREKWIKADKDEAARKEKAAAKKVEVKAATSLPAEQMLDMMYHKIADQNPHPSHAAPAALKVLTESKEQRVKRIMDSIGKEKDVSESLRAGNDAVQKKCPDCRQTPDEAYSLKPVNEVFAPTPDPNFAAKVRNMQIQAQANAFQYQQQQQAFAAQKAKAEAKQAADVKQAYAAAAEQQRQYKAKVDKYQHDESKKAAKKNKQQKMISDEKAKLDADLKDQWENYQRLQEVDRKKDEAEDQELAIPYQSGDGD